MQLLIGAERDETANEVRDDVIVFAANENVNMRHLDLETVHKLRLELDEIFDHPDGAIRQTELECEHVQADHLWLRVVALKIDEWSVLKHFNALGQVHVGLR